MCFCTVCRYSEFYLFHQQVFRDVKKREKQSLIPDFPPRYSKSALGISLSHSELKDRTEKLEKYFKAMIAIIDDLSPDSQSLFRALLGGRVSTMVSPALMTEALADDIAEDAGLPTLYYWGMKARGQIPIMLLTAGKVDFKWEQDPGDYKQFAPFGQLPVLKVRFCSF